MINTNLESAQASAQNYELMVLLDGDLGEKEFEKELEKIRNILTGVKGKIQEEDIWGKRDLAYIIKKKETGYYAVFQFMVHPEKINEISKDIKLEKYVLRHILVRQPDNYNLEKFKEHEKEIAEQNRLRQEQRKQAEMEREQNEEQKPVKKVRKIKFETETSIKEETAKVEEKAEEKLEEPKIKESKIFKTKAAEETSLDDVDAKIRDIINDPTINL